MDNSTTVRTRKFATMLIKDKFSRVTIIEFLLFDDQKFHRIQ